MSLALYSYWRSSSSYRVRIVLALKRIDYEYKRINLLELFRGQDHATFGGINPMNQVPVLEITKDDGKKDYLVQSLPIIEYIEESYPGTYAILPSDTLLRQKTRAMAELINSGIQPLQNLAILDEIEKLGGDKLEWSQKVINKGLTALEKMISKTSGRFCVGDDITMVDVFLIPQLYNARRFGVNIENYKQLYPIYQRCLEMEAFDKASPEKQPDYPGPGK